MLTKQFEGGNVKCGKYWSDGQYGPYQLRHVSTSGAKEEEDPGSLGCGGSDGGGGFFNLNPQDSKENKPEVDDIHNYTICRKFELRHAAYPHKKPRIITQMQYLGWPDMNVPENPKSFLRFMQQVDELVDRSHTEPDSDDDSKKNRPALLHCSAGVGRTGAFIVIDAVLDGIRRELRRVINEHKKAISQEQLKLTADSHARYRDAMDIDIGNAVANRIEALPSSSSSFHLSKSGSSNQETPLARTHSSGLVSTTEHIGPLATLQVGNKRSSLTDIHIPIVPSNATISSPLKTPRPTQLRELPPPVPVSPTRSTQGSRVARPFVSRAFAGPKASSRRIIAPDFTVADADSMFMGAALNPAFAMDVESIQPSSKQFTSSSSSGEGSASGGDLASSSSASGSSGRTRPLVSALSKMSSSDDVPGPTERSDSDSIVSARFSLRNGIDDGKSSGSGSGEGAPSFSGRSAGYSSASSFAPTGSSLSSGPSTSSSSGRTSSSGAAHASFDERSRLQVQHHPQRPNSLMHKPSLLAPKPRIPVQASDLVDSEAPTPMTAIPAHLKSSGAHSSTSQSSSTDNSSPLFSSPINRLSSETNFSAHEDSQSPAPLEQPEPELRRLAGTSFDYVTPRRLHGEDSPPLLSSLEQPIRQILEDMREQRMSLCQSLRQYVFVHNAIIEGALQITDEEKSRAGIDDVNTLLTGYGQHTENVMPLAAQTTGKRGASPTELTKEDKKGDVALAKRPSIKRGQSLSTSSSGSTAGTG